MLLDKLLTRASQSLRCRVNVKGALLSRKSTRSNNGKAFTTYILRHKECVLPCSGVHRCRSFTTLSSNRNKDSEMALFNVNLADEFGKLNFSVFDDYLFQVFFPFLFYNFTVKLYRYLDKSQPLSVTNVSHSKLVH